MIELRISDDGRGFDPDSAELSEAMGFGLLSMQQRAEELRGRLSLTSGNRDLDCGPAAEG